MRPQLRRSLRITATAALSAGMFAATTATAGAQSLPHPRPPRQSRQSVFVQTKNPAGNQIDVFAVSRSGYLSSVPTVTTGGSNIPFAFVYTPSGQLVVAEAAASALHSFSFGPGETLTSLGASVPDKQMALCWVATAGPYYYVANAGSANVSAYPIAADGTPALLNGTGIPTATSLGPIDLAASHNGRFLYVESGSAGTVSEFRVNPDGSLGDLGTVDGLGTGIEGIATS